MKNIINDASVNEWFTQQMASLTPMKMLLALLMGFIVGLIIALVYRKAFRGVLFSPSFANTLIMLCMITTPVVMCIKSNIALSMGMVGALSIVRFRTAVKDPLDTAYMFWSLTMGILLGAELYTIALVVVAAFPSRCWRWRSSACAPRTPSCSSPITIRPPKRRSWISSAASRCSVCAARPSPPAAWN